MEWDLFFRADGGDGERLAALREWTEKYLVAISRGQGDARKSRQVPPDLEAMLRASGFVHVQSNTYDVPLGTWPSSKFRIGCVKTQILTKFSSIFARHR